HAPPPASVLFPYTTLFRSGEEGDLGRVDAAADGEGVDFADGGFAGFLGRAAGAHLLDDEKAAGDADDFLADPRGAGGAGAVVNRSEEHTSELQSRVDLVCR